MAKLDDPRARIVRLFELESKEGRPGAEVFGDGICPVELPLEPGERVFGVYKQIYFFTPRSFVQRTTTGFERFRWGEVAQCSTRHGDGATFAEVRLGGGETVRVRVGDFATGWSGRISQLFHQLIERHGASAFLGQPLWRVAQFFDRATDAYSLLPNLEPHPSLAELQAALGSLEESPGISGVWLSIAEVDGNEPIADAVVVKGLREAPALVAFATSYGADGVLAAGDAARAQVGEVVAEEGVWQIVWD